MITRDSQGTQKSETEGRPYPERRISLSNFSIARRLPILIGLLLIAIVFGSTWASYRGVKESALEVGRERLLNLTQQLANQSQQSLPIVLGRTFAAANDPAVHAFLRSPSSATRPGARSALQQFSPTQDPNSLQVELWNIDRTLALIEPEDASPEPADLSTEFKQCATDPFKVVGPIRVVNSVVVYTAVAGVKDDAGKIIAYLVRWRRAAATANVRRQLADLLGSQAAVYYGNSQGDVWTDLEKAAPKPPVNLAATLQVTHYTRDGNSVMALGRPIGGTPWFLIVEFPEQPLLAESNRFLRRMLLIDFALLLIGEAGAFALSRNISRPLRSLTEAASRVSAGDYSHSVDIHQHDELGRLANAFNEMVVKVRDTQRELERNIQDLKLAQDATSRLAALVESSHDAIIGKSLDGIITSWNQGAEDLYGYSAEEVIGQSIAILAPREQPDEIPAIMERLRQGNRLDHFETQRITKEGKRISVSLTISPIVDDSGVTSGFSTIAHDITERRHAEAALQTSELRYRRLFESAKDGILILNAESGQIIDVNPFLIEMLGYSREDFLGKELWELGFFKDVLDSKVAFVELQQQGYIRYDDLPLKTRGGIVKQVEFVSNTYLVDGRRVIQCNIRDITERQGAEQTLKETNQRLERTLSELQAKRDELTGMTQQLWQASKLATMGELAASVAHELNNPLATISLRLDSLATQLAHDGQESHDVDIVVNEVERMGKLVGGLLQFGRRSHQQISTIDICGEIDNALELTEYYFRSHKIQVVRQFDSSLPTVPADREQLRQVFLNLMTNASDAMPQGGKLIVRARAQADDGVKSVRIELADSGPGIAPADLEKLWEPFFTTKPEGKGTGLGLAICRRVVEAHHGSIAIDSRLGEGTTVRIMLPATNGASKTCDESGPLLT